MRFEFPAQQLTTAFTLSIHREGLVQKKFTRERHEAIPGFHSLKAIAEIIRRGALYHFVLLAYHLRYAVPAFLLNSKRLTTSNEITPRIGADAHQLPI